MIKTYKIEKSITDTVFINALEVHLCGLIRVSGWANGSEQHLSEILIRINGIKRSPDVTYRTYRPDVNERFSVDGFLGFELEYFLMGDRVNDVNVIVESSSGVEKSVFEVDSILLETYVPDYIHLRNGEAIYDRSQIYGSGPPVDHVDVNVIEAIKRLEGSVLDFGCGKGALIKELLKNNLEVCGIEIERPEILSALTDDMKRFIKLYDGGLPLPFEDGQFNYVTCVEVLEHIPEVYEQVLSEISRVAKQGLLLTVPDMSSITILHKYGVIPWHLLESTHFNFFNSITLVNLLKKNFSKVELMKVGAFDVNGTRCYTSLMAYCEK